MADDRKHIIERIVPRSTSFNVAALDVEPSRAVFLIPKKHGITFPLRKRFIGDRNQSSIDGPLDALSLASDLRRASLAACSYF